jgi:hypothetical protein
MKNESTLSASARNRINKKAFIQAKEAVLRIRTIRMFLGLLDPDPDPLVRDTDPDPAPDPSIIKQK